MTGTKIGLMPFEQAENYNIRFTRRAVSINKPHYEQQGVHRILLNINQSIGKPYPEYDTNMVFYADKLEQTKRLIDIDRINPVCISIENEELLHGNIDDYLKQLETAVNVFSAYRVTNGGLTLPELSYWYWQATDDNAFYTRNIPTNQKAALLGGSLNDVSDKVDKELTFLKSLKIPYINIHYYIGYAGAVDGLIRMFNYVKQYTGKDLTSNEAGTYTSGLLPEVVRIARETEMRHLILYSGEGVEGQVPAKALPISKTDFETVVI